MLLKKKVIYERVDVDIMDTMTLTAAADFLGMTRPGVIRAIERGRLTEIIDDQVKGNNYGRRLLVKSEIEAFSLFRQKNE